MESLAEGGAREDDLGLRGAQADDHVQEGVLFWFFVKNKCLKYMSFEYNE